MNFIQTCVRLGWSFLNTKEWELSGMKAGPEKEDCSSVNMLGENMDKDFP